MSNLCVFLYQGRGGADGGRGMIGETGAKVKKNGCHTHH